MAQFGYVPVTVTTRRGWWQATPVRWVTLSAPKCGSADTLYVRGEDEWEEWRRIEPFRWRRR